MRSSDALYECAEMAPNGKALAILTRAAVAVANGSVHPIVVRNELRMYVRHTDDPLTPDERAALDLAVEALS